MRVQREDAKKRWTVTDTRATPAKQLLQFDIESGCEWKQSEMAEFKTCFLVSAIFVYSNCIEIQPLHKDGLQLTTQSTPMDIITANEVDSNNSLALLVNSRLNKSIARKQNSRFLNIFSVIDIPNTSCQSSHKPLRELNGTCYHPNQCSKLGGQGQGKCADGFGVCCFCE